MELDRRRRPIALLILGAVAGVAIAAAGLLDPAARSGGIPAGVAARVNGHTIRMEEYQRVLSGLVLDARTPPDREARRRVLERMIEEELLVQRGLELGLARVDRRIRGELVAAVIASVASGADALEPTLDELRAFHAKELGFFARPGRLHVRQIQFRSRDSPDSRAARARADEARRRLLAGDRMEDVRRLLGDSEISPLPDAALPPGKLRQYVGPSALDVVLSLEVGEVSEPVSSGGGFRVLELVEREPDRSPPFEEIESQVRVEWRRRAADRSLREYLDDLRARARIDIVPELD